MTSSSSHQKGICSSGHSSTVTSDRSRTIRPYEYMLISSVCSSITAVQDKGDRCDINDSQSVYEANTEVITHRVFLILGQQMSFWRRWFWRSRLCNGKNVPDSRAIPEKRHVILHHCRSLCRLRGSFSVPSVSDNFRIFCFYYDVDLTCAIAQIWLSVYFQIPILRPTFLTLNPSCRVQGIFTKLSTVC